jgi:hypothetical protein
MPPYDVTPCLYGTQSQEPFSFAFGLFLIGVAAVVFARPAVAERLFLAFASSARTHYTEQAVRLLVGALLIIRSADMWQPKLLWFVGWTIEPEQAKYSL